MSIRTMPKFDKVGLPISGKDSIFPFMTIMRVRVCLVWFWIITKHCPRTGISCKSARSFILDFFSRISGLVVWNRPNCSSSIMFWAVHKMPNSFKKFLQISEKVAQKVAQKYLKVSQKLLYIF